MTIHFLKLLVVSYQLKSVQLVSTKIFHKIIWQLVEVRRNLNLSVPLTPAARLMQFGVQVNFSQRNF